MHFSDWLRTLPAPNLSPGRSQWLSVCAEAQVPLVARSWADRPPNERRFVLVVRDHERAVQCQALLGLCGVPESHIFLLPTAQSSLYDDAPPERVALSDRAAALWALASASPCVVIATAQSVLERCLPAEVFCSAAVTIKIGEEYSLTDVTKRLDSLGYEREDPVRRPGGYSVRGGILDVFPAGAELPTRIELFGDTTESLRRFDPESQRSIFPADSVTILPLRSFVFYGDVNNLADATIALANNQSKMLPKEIANELVALTEADAAAIRKRVFFDRMELYAPLLSPQTACALDYAKDAFVFLGEPLELTVRASRARDDLKTVLTQRNSDGSALLFDAEEYILPEIRLFQSANVIGLSSLQDSVPELSDAHYENVGYHSLATYRGRSTALALAVRAWQTASVRIAVATDQPTRARAVLKELHVYLADSPETGNSALLLKGNPAGGFVNTKAGIALLTDAELFGVCRLRLPQRKFFEGTPISSILDLNPGDYVVHIQHGIGRYRGLVTRKVDNVEKEFLHIEYQPPDSLLVPTDQLDRIQKYLSPSDSPPTIHRITGGDWMRTLKNAKKGAEDLARDLIRIYAKRAATERPPLGEDSPWQAEMEATFHWVETPAQLRAIEEIKTDLSEPHPMDRLVCGDVGFGKTEVAVRTAFKVVQAGKQVAVLCPTTVLSDQHYDTFRERLAAYPIKLALLNRFRKARERRETLDGLQSGSIDIVIGTHALLQSGVKFKNLGLVIIDEEQRFGVKHKERLKDLRATVDVLTLTATPIPRTLSMALMNIREMSLISDPPPGRLPVRTYVRPYGDHILREALLRELARGGQSFYVFNRVQGISHVADRIKRFVPNARIAVAHGRMAADELEPVMSAFFHGDIDILVCTTIIENGIDNPNANTMIVENADKMGLAQLYQLRGRVGRSDRQAYAYFLYRSGKQLTETGIDRLKALQEFSELGSGYALAFRDLQIRGAGELLGAKQHGVMASVGYEMYVLLINQAVQQLKLAMDASGERGVRMTNLNLQETLETGFSELPAFEVPAEAYLPKSYIPDQSQRLFMYKKLMEARDDDALREVKIELVDRYGRLPNAAEAAINLVRLRIWAKRLGIQKITENEKKLMVWLKKGHELPLKTVHALQRAHKGLRFRPDLLEWKYSDDVLASIEDLLFFMQTHKPGREEKKAAVAGTAGA